MTESRKYERVALKRFIDQVDNEGISYAVFSYYAPGHCPTPEIEQMWREAREAMYRLADYLGVSRP